MSSQAMRDLRPSCLAGTPWYVVNPGDDLATTIDKLLASAPDATVPGQITGLIAPHAGYEYSGKIAGHAFRLVKGLSFERVIVVSPMHRAYIDPIQTSGHQAYQTPLGIIEVDREALLALDKKVGIKPVKNDEEHSLEIELPFLQRALAAPFRLVPLMLSDQSYSLAERLGNALAEIVGKDSHTLLVASSDLSHYYPEAKAHELDRVMMKLIEDFKPEEVIRADLEGRAFACGRAAIATVMVAARGLGADKVYVAGYGTSGDDHFDKSRVVGYGAAAIYKAA